MKAPKFWQYDGVLAELLFPFSLFFYLYGLFRRAMTRTEKVKAKVICVGNVVAGGAGKTPAAIALAKLLLKKNKKVAFVSKGYGGKTKFPTKVDEKKHSYKDVGDEPLLLSRIAPCWVGESRVAAARTAIDYGARILILDDGFQDNSLAKDFSFLVFDGGYGIGNGFLIPAGPLRGKLKPALKQSDAIIFVGLDKTGLRAKIKTEKPEISAQFQPVSRIKKSEKYLAFAGIGRPQKFFDTLSQHGANVAHTEEFPDHYPYAEKDIRDLKKKAGEMNARLITTEKDSVRIPKKLLKDIEIFKAEIKFGDEDSLEKLIK